MSFTGFCLTQIVIDCESAYFLFRGAWPVHRFFHTFIGASLLCSATCVVFFPLLNRLWLRLSRTGDEHLKRWLRHHSVSNWATVLTTIVLGVLGHVVPDGIMHSDIRPFAPFTEQNPLHEILGLGSLHGALVVAGAIGFLATRLRRTAQ